MLALNHSPAADLEKLAVSPRGFFPARDVCEHDSGANHVFQFAASFLLSELKRQSPGDGEPGVERAVGDDAEALVGHFSESAPFVTLSRISATICRAKANACWASWRDTSPATSYTN